MRKAIILFLSVIAGLYFGVHLVLGSSPVQRRVLGHLKEALLEYGIELQIESLEFSAFSPKLYLSRVTVSTTPKAEVQLDYPLEVDKIKVQFQPLALLSRTIVIDEASLYHPKILVPRADQLYKKVLEKVNSRKRIIVKGGTGWPVDFRKIGIVDAEFEVASKVPSFSIRSRSLTVFVSQSAAGQATLEVEAPNLELERGKLKLPLNKVVVDLDATEKSVRVNTLALKAEGLDLKWKGAFSLPFKAKGPESFHLSHETSLDLAFLNHVPELGVSGLSGMLASQGTVHAGAGLYSGTGKLEGSDIGFQGYKFGNPSFLYSLNDKRASLTQVEVDYAGGKVSSGLITVDFMNRLPIKGELELKGVELQELLANLKSNDAPIKMALSGKVKTAGFLAGPLAIVGEPELAFKNLWVIAEPTKPLTLEEQVLFIPEGRVRGSLNVSAHQLAFVANVDALEGKIAAEGKLGFDGDVGIHVDAKQISLSRLHKIADLEFGGKADIVANVDVSNGSGKVLGQLDIRDGIIAGLKVGTIKGNAQYSRGLLSFSNIELRAMETVRGNGFVDFAPKRTRYRFDIDAKRLTMDQLLAVFQEVKLPFESPVGGEVSTRVTIEGGDDDKGIQVTANGQARSFHWYQEGWMSANFGFTYRPGFVRVHRGVLLKRSGSLEARAEFTDTINRLTLFTSGMRLEELNHIGQSPLQGKVEGRWELEGDLRFPKGNGNLQFTKVSFRGAPIPDSELLIQSTKGSTRYSVSLAKDRFKGTLTRKDGLADQERGDLKFEFKDFDFAPFLSLWLEKDLPPIRELRATGIVDLAGDFMHPETLDGSGTISSLLLGLKGNPMRAEPVKIEVKQGAVTVAQVKLTGSESQISGKFSLHPKTAVHANLDAKIDLQYLQPFIPGVDYGVGQVSIGLQVTGRPSNFDMIGNASLQDGVFRLTGLVDEFRSTNAQVSISQDRLTVEKFQAALGGGDVTINGDVRIDRFQRFSPSLAIYASKVSLRTGDMLTSRVTGDFSLKGSEAPYLLAGRCQVEQVRLTSFNAKMSASSSETVPALRFDIKGEANDQILVQTDVMDAEFKGDFHLLGDTNQVGLLGSVESIRGSLLFKDTRFDLESAVAKFEDEKKISPRFNVSGRTVVREQKGAVTQDYEINLQVLGTPTDYKIRLSSTPPLSEPDLVSLLVLGVTTREQEGNYLNLGSTIVGQTPFQSKIQDELGFDIKVGTAQGQPGNATNASSGAGTADATSTVPSVKIEKGLTKKTKVSYSNTLDDNQAREFKIEQMLNDNFTVNATASDRGRTTTQSARPGDSFGLDFRYRFNFE